LIHFLGLPGAETQRRQKDFFQRNQSWEKCLSDFTNQLTEKFGLNDNTISYYVVAYNEKNVQQEVVTIFEDFIKHRQELEKKNRNFSGLSMRFITSQYLKGNG
jgi:hypothetical protein